MLYKIYCLKNEDEEIMYIGYTSLSEARRMCEHRHSHPHRRAYTFHVLDVFDNKKDALEAERAYISAYNPPENIAPGQGYPASLAAGRIISHKNASLPVECIDTGIIYESISAAAEATGSNRNHVKDCCRKRRHMTNGLHFRFVEDLREAKGVEDAHADTEVITESKDSVTP